MASCVLAKRATDGTRTVMISLESNHATASEKRDVLKRLYLKELSISATLAGVKAECLLA